MKEFMMAALPWICIGIAIALLAASHGMAKKAKDSGKEHGNYMTEGMCLGMCVGTALGDNGLIYGMLLGLVVGMLIKKEWMSANREAKNNEKGCR